MKLQLFDARRMSGLLCPFCTLCQIGGAVFVGQLPWYLPRYLAYKYDTVDNITYWAMMALLLVSGISAFIILQYAKRVLRGIYKQNPFTMEVAGSIKNISRWCLPIAGIYLLGMVFLPSALVLLVGIAFLFLALFIHIIAELVYQAARFKEENDLTI